MTSIRVLQIFNRYENYGGEEGSVRRIKAAMQEFCEVESFETSTKEFLSSRGFGRALLPIRALNNWAVTAQLREIQRVRRFHVWQVHNVFPTMSPAVYSLAFDLGIPVLQFLHNYRLSCANGFFLNHGEPCQRCMHGNFWPAFQTACWRDSHLVSGMMGMVLWRTRNLGVFDRVSRWVALSESEKAEYVKLGVTADRIEVVHHFLEPTQPPPPAGDGRTALYIGRLSPEKGVGQLLEAWKLLDRMEARLVIVGDGPERNALEAKAAQLNLHGVKFTGFVTGAEQRAIWAGADFGVAPSIWLEPFGMVVLEAWANARPVVATAHGSFLELIEHGRTGLLARPFDPGALADQLKRMFDSPQDAAAMGQAGLHALQTRFTRQLWVNKMRHIYDKLDVAAHQ